MSDLSESSHEKGRKNCKAKMSSTHKSRHAACYNAIEVHLIIKLKKKY